MEKIKNGGGGKKRTGAKKENEEEEKTAGQTKVVEAKLRGFRFQA